MCCVHCVRLLCVLPRLLRHLMLLLLLLLLLRLRLRLLLLSLRASPLAWQRGLNEQKGLK